MGFVEKDGLRYFQFDLFHDQPLCHAILTRQGGFSQPPFDQLNTGGTVGDDPEAVLKNHQVIFDRLGLDFASRFDVWQVHGKRIETAEAPRGEGTPHTKADGILTNKPEVTLLMRFADCVPILLYDPVQRVMGIVHAGWQGTVKKIAQAAIQKMSSAYNSQPADILAGIGPSICPDCYEVGQNVRSAFREAFGKESELFFRELKGRLTLDLWAANQATLKAAGVHQVEVSALCTACNPQDWYSHRAQNGRTGRFAALMAWKRCDERTG